MKATKSIVLLLVLNKLRKRKILFRRKMKHFCTVYAETRLLLPFRIYIASALKSENSSPTPLLDDQQAKVVLKNDCWKG